MCCPPPTSWQALPVLSPPSHTHTPFSPLFQGSLAENYHISCVIALASWAGPRLAWHWQPEMSPATQVGTGSPAPEATRDKSPGGNVTRLRPTTGSPTPFPGLAPCPLPASLCTQPWGRGLPGDVDRVSSQAGSQSCLQQQGEREPLKFLFFPACWGRN